MMAGQGFVLKNAINYVSIISSCAFGVIRLEKYRGAHYVALPVVERALRQVSNSHLTIVDVQDRPGFMIAAKGRGPRPCA